MAFFAALGASLSCTTPLAEAAPAGGGSLPEAPPATVQELSAQLTWFRRDSVGPSHYRIEVQAVDGLGNPVALAPLAWVTASPLDFVDGPAAAGPDGRAQLEWRARSAGDEMSLLEIRSGEWAVVRLAAVGEQLLSGGDGGAGRLSPRDTVGAVLPQGILVQVVDGSGRPAPGVMLRVEASPGGGTVSQAQLVTDSGGRAATSWQLDGRAGTQAVAVRFGQRTEGLRIRDARTGLTAAAGSPLPVRATALPGAPQRIVLAASDLAADAVGARLRITASSYDRHGNVVLQPPLQLHSSDTGVVQPAMDGSLITTGSGMARVRVATGAAGDSVLVTVLQRAVDIHATATAPVLTRLGARTQFRAEATDRLGTAVEGAAIEFRLLTPDILNLVAGDSVVALAPGTGMIEAVYLELVDTLSIPVAPVAASIVLARTADTMELDESRVIPLQVFDSGGAPITRPALWLQSGDTTVLEVLASHTVRARLPGEAGIKLRSGPVEVVYRVTVEGVALLADGARSPGTAAVGAARTLELTNGRVRLRWHPRLSERGGFEMDTRIGGTWIPATVRGAGDWLYVTSTVLTEPTAITVVQESPGEVALAMRFGSHRFDPVLAKYPPHYQNEPFPFTRTLWLRPREYGYFSWTEIERSMVWTGTELEIGFGGMFGPATIRTGQMTFTTEAMTRHNRFNVASVPDAAELDLHGDPLLRVLVPLPEAPMISPVFPGWGYGSVYVHRSEYKSYGAYLYAAPRALAVPPRQICLDAWAQAPFPLRALTPAEMAACGAS